MIQGGCPLGTGTGGPGYGIVGEFASNGHPNPCLLYTSLFLTMDFCYRGKKSKKNKKEQKLWMKRRILCLFK